VFGLLALAVFGQSPGPDDARKRKALLPEAFPDQEMSLYVEVPATDDALSDTPTWTFRGTSLATRQIADFMARGARSPTYLVVGGENDSVTCAAVAKALDTFKGQFLPLLHLALIGNIQQAEQLRLAVEGLGAEYRVLPSPPHGN